MSLTPTNRALGKNGKKFLLKTNNSTCSENEELKSWLIVYVYASVLSKREITNKNNIKNRLILIVEKECDSSDV